MLLLRMLENMTLKGLTSKRQLPQTQHFKKIKKYDAEVMIY